MNKDLKNLKKKLIRFIRRFVKIFRNVLLSSLPLLVKLDGIFQLFLTTSNIS